MLRCHTLMLPIFSPMLRLMLLLVSPAAIAYFAIDAAAPHRRHRVTTPIFTILADVDAAAFIAFADTPLFFAAMLPPHADAMFCAPLRRFRLIFSLLFAPLPIAYFDAFVAAIDTIAITPPAFAAITLRYAISCRYY